MIEAGMIIFKFSRRVGLILIKAALTVWLVIWGASLGLLTWVPFFAVYLGAVLASEGMMALSFYFTVVGGFLSVWTLCLLAAAFDCKPPDSCKPCRICLWLADVMEGYIK